MWFVLLACATPTPTAAPEAPAPRAVQMALNWYPEPEFGGFYEAKLSGAAAAAGIDLTLVPGGPGVPVLELLEAGRVDVAITGADDLLVRRAKGLDAVAIFPGFQDSPLGLMSHADAGLRRFEDVRGTVAIEQGSPFQLFLASRYAWGDAVRMVPTSGTIGPFAADPTLVQQAYITSEPCIAEAQGLKVDFLPGRDAGWNPYASLVVVRGKDKDAPWVAALRGAVRAGWEGYLADPSRANAEIAKANLNLAPAQLDCVVARQRPFVTGTDGLGVMSAARWDAIEAALDAVGVEVEADGAWM